MLELYEAKVSCTVLRGESGGNPTDLPDSNKFEMPSLAQLIREKSTLN